MKEWDSEMGVKADNQFRSPGVEAGFSHHRTASVALLTPSPLSNYLAQWLQSNMLLSKGVVLLGHQVLE